MSFEIISSIPVNSNLVPSFLEKIINKKIANIALNILEKWMDWFCSRIYFPYATLYQKKCARIHHFSDELQLIDLTQQGIAHIDQKTNMIYLGELQVRFNLCFKRQFSKDTAAYVLIFDNEKPHEYKIVEQELSHPKEKPMEKSWNINANTIYQESPSQRFLLAN